MKPQFSEQKLKSVCVRGGGARNSCFTVTYFLLDRVRHPVPLGVDAIPPKGGGSKTVMVGGWAEGKGMK